MSIPFNAPGRQYQALKEQIDAAIARVLASGWYLMGEETRAFEQEFADYCGTPHCVTVASGTDALELALRVAGCGTATEVITVANAGGYTTTACNLVGAVPVYVDIDPATLLMDFTSVLAAVTPQTRVVMVTHLFGAALDVPRLRDMLNAAGHAAITLIEDCAQAHGAERNGRRVGGLGDLATFSFYPTKNLGALGDGGAVVCQSPEAAAQLRGLKQYGWTAKYTSTIPHSRNSRMDELHAAVLRVKLQHLDRFNARRREIVAAYRAAAGKSLTILGRNDTAHVAHLCVALSDHRDTLRAALAEAGVPTDIHYPVLDPNQPCMEHIPHIAHPLPHSRTASERIFSLPCYPEITLAEQDSVCAALAALTP